MTDFYIHQPDRVFADDLTTRVLKNCNSIAYHQTLKSYQVTPLWSINDFASRYGIKKVWIKDESYRFGLNAFKGLGVSYAMHLILKEQPNIETFCTATDGNHGRAVAWAAQQAGKKSVVFVPGVTTRQRIDAIEREGGKVIQVDGDYDYACRQAEEKCKQNGWTLLQDTAWEGYEEIPAWIMAGYCTMYRELELILHRPDDPGVDVIFLQAGVGSWAASAIWYYANRYGRSCPRVVIVEPSESDGIYSSLRAGKLSLPARSGYTMMAGLNCGVPSLTAWPLIKSFADAIITIPDTMAARAIRELYYPTGNDPSITAGESGVAGVAGFIAACTDPKLQSLRNHLKLDENCRALFFITEGVTDVENFKSIIT